jgi:acyl-[acyl-carrier-protein]-phospholipid O-acyltransferase/long-chain-fatty-acid--[acyl-carrier-protein] ligase
MTFTPAKTLKDRSYIGLVLSQFLAAFNDQAIHIVAIFYASDLLHGYVRYADGRFDQKLIVSLVTACFISPFFFFSPLAGILADKYSKQRTIVFWKVAEVFITGLALFAFLLPHFVDGASMKTAATISSFLMIAAVFLMGTHSAFFVPAKYGIMPEILHTSILSRGNGLLEGTSFVSQILGTSFGGYLYFFCKSRPSEAAIDTGGLILGSEWKIGLVLFALAFVGAAFSLLVARIPAAAPDRQLTLNPLVPLAKNFGELRRSRPLVLATIGIAFFTFMTLFLRQTLLYQGETNKELGIAKQRNEAVAAADVGTKKSAEEPSQLDELWIATLVALLGFGVGAGCTLAGKLSGSRLELGLVPVGTMLLILLTIVLGFVARPPPEMHNVQSLFKTLSETALAQWGTIVCLLAIGLAAGLYIVPLYTLLQHRAPKDSKGNMVATSNFVNVTGGLMAVIMFYGVTYLFESIQGNKITPEDATQRAAYVAQVEAHQSIPRMLFFTASGATLLVLLAFVRLRPDFLLRMISYFKQPSRRTLRAIGADHVPSYGPLLIVSNASSLADWVNIVSVVDRKLSFVWQEPNANSSDAGLRGWALRTGIGNKLTDQPAQRGELLNLVQKQLLNNDLVGIPVIGLTALTVPEFQHLSHTRNEPNLRLLPIAVRSEAGQECVVVGGYLPAMAGWDELQAALQHLLTAPLESLAVDHGH